MIVQQNIASADLVISQEITDTQLVNVTKTPLLNQLYCGYTNGTVKIFNTNNGSILEKIHLYQNGEVIDLEVMDSNIITCSHSEVTVYSLEKNRSLSLKGHQSTPFFLACHPVSPLVLSCSNILILHDLRIQKPINVNFITPPAYSLEYFSDGQFFVLGGQPVRVGNSQWVRTLLNGLAQPSLNGKHVLTNQMNGKLSFWDWRESEQLVSWQGLKNQNIYQIPYFGMVNGKTRNALFLDEQCSFFSFSILEGTQDKIKLNYIDNSKIFVDKLESNTQQFYRYSANGTIEKYKLTL